MKVDRAKFWPGFFKDFFFGVGLVSHPVSSEMVDRAWRCPCKPV